MQKNGLANYSSFLVSSGLEKCITYGCGHFNNDFPVNQAFFGMLTTKRTTKQPGDPSASLLLTSVRRQSFAILVQILKLVLVKILKLYGETNVRLRF